MEFGKRIAELKKIVGNITKQYEGFFQALKGNVVEVIIIGHSLGEVDLPYFKKIQDEAVP